MQYDVIIIGGGIVGAATARQVKMQFPAMKVLLLEKEAKAAMHQTGRNSGVIHAGVYYPPGSLKAEYCRLGLLDTIEFCQQKHIAYDQCGKLLVATNELELQRMEALYQRCKDNDLAPELLSATQLVKTEPAITGKGAFKIARTGIVNYSQITRAMLDEFIEAGGEVAFNTEVTALHEGSNSVSVSSGQQTFEARFLLACSGLMADRLVSMLGVKPDFQIIPFRGEYYRLPANYNALVKHLIYPIPDPDLPFLGVHLTRMIDGSVTVGPNAVLAWAREGYSHADISLADMMQMIGYKGFWPLIRRYKRSGLQELKNSLFKAGYLQQVQKYCPQIKREDLLSYPSGVRAQAVSDKGEMIHDFKFVQTPNSLHVGNAPSPAATSAMPIARAIVERLQAHIQ